MWRQHRNENPILIRIVDEFEVDMTAVAVYN